MKVKSKDVKGEKVNFKDVKENKNNSKDLNEEKNLFKDVKEMKVKEDNLESKKNKNKKEENSTEAKHKKRDLCCSEESKIKKDICTDNKSKRNKKDNNFKIENEEVQINNSSTAKKTTKNKKNILSKEEIVEENKSKDRSIYKKSHSLSTNHYIRNILIVSNLAYKETEESISECFKSYGAIEKVQMSYSKDGKFIGKAIVTFKHDVKIDNEIVWNHKVLRIERMKNKIVNDKRIFVSHINKNLTILQIRNILKEFGVKPKDIRTRFESETKRNNGYCHITYTDSEDAKKFEKEWSKFKAKLGQEVFFEYAHEKVNKSGKYRK